MAMDRVEKFGSYFNNDTFMDKKSRLFYEGKQMKKECSHLWRMGSQIVKVYRGEKKIKGYNVWCEVCGTMIKAQFAPYKKWPESLFYSDSPQTKPKTSLRPKGFDSQSSTEIANIGKDKTADSLRGKPKKLNTPKNLKGGVENGKSKLCLQAEG